MKLLICILQDSDKDSVVKALNKEEYRITVLPSSGAYFRRGNTTLFIGIEDKQVNPVIEIIKENCAEPKDPGLKRATIFVLNVNKFEQV